MIGKLLACTAIAVALTACETMPRVKYGQAVGDTEGKIKFNVAASVIVVKSDTKRNQDGFPYERTLNISSSLIEESENPIVYSITPVSDLVSSTKVMNVTYHPNTRMIESIGTEVTDNRVKTLQTVVAVASAAKGMVMGEEKPADVPADTVLDIRPALAAGQPRFEKQLDAQWKAVVDFGPVPKDAVKRDALLASPALGNVTGAYLYSACRPATITLKKTTGTAYTVSLVVSDPTYLQTMAFPAKGTITHHSSCGVNVVEQRSATGIPDGTDKLIEDAKSLLAKSKSGS